VTNLRNQAQSVPQPLVKLYNRVADNQDSDWDACVSAAALPGTAGGANGSGSLRITANHSYGTLDIGFAPFHGERAAAWVTFSLIDLTAWKGDPVQRHVKFALMCPSDICAASPAIYPNREKNLGNNVNGLFQGWRGAEGHYPDSTGFLTISSDCKSARSQCLLLASNHAHVATGQQQNEMYFAHSGWKVAYTLAPTAVLPKVWAGVRANHPEIPKPNKNRARTWYWAGGDAANLDETIALVKSMGIDSRGRVRHYVLISI
jgi:hypothetical protein